LTLIHTVMGNLSQIPSLLSTADGSVFRLTEPILLMPTTDSKRIEIRIYFIVCFKTANIRNCLWSSKDQIHYNFLKASYWI